MTISTQEAVGILRLLGCSDDPVRVHGVDTEVANIAHLEEPSTPSRLRVKFWNRHGRRVDGTLAGLVLDRLGLARNPKRKAPRVKA